MRCDRCGREAIHIQRYSGSRLCGQHLAASIEARARRIIRKRGWIRPGDRIAVGLSGGPGSGSLLRFLSVLSGMRRDLSLVALTIDEGPGSGMDMARIQGIAGGMGIEWTGTCIREKARDPENGTGEGPLALHRRLRDRALASLARETGATRLALGTSLDDEAGSVLLPVIRGEAGRLVGRGEEALEGIPLIRPFTRIPMDELSLYARLTVPDRLPPRERKSIDPLEGEVSRMVADYTTRHPSALFAVAHLGEGLAGMTGQPSGWPVMETPRRPGGRPVVHPEGERTRDGGRGGTPDGISPRGPGNREQEQDHG